MAFTLRQVKETGLEFNNILGTRYDVYHVHKSAELFKSLYKDVFEENYTTDSKVYAFVCVGSIKFPLYLGDRNYIVTETGKTFAHISF
jgi:hypothetical protein